MISTIRQKLEANNKYGSRILEKLIRWYLFGIVISIIPLWIKHNQLTYGNLVADNNAVLKDGSLFLLAAAISASAIGEVIGKTEQFSVLKLTGAGGSIAGFAIGVGQWATISIKEPVSVAPAVSDSIHLFVYSLIFGTLCIYVSEDK